MIKNTNTLSLLLYSADCDFQPSESYVIIYLFMCKVLYQNMLLISIIMIFKITIRAVCLHQTVNKKNVLFSSYIPIQRNHLNSTWTCFPAQQANDPIYYLMNIVIELHEIRPFQKFFPNFCDHFAIDKSIQNDVIPIEISLCTCILRICLDRNTT